LLKNVVGEKTIVSHHVATLAPFVWKENAPLQQMDVVMSSAQTVHCT
jgi:hypothetical protein